MPNLSQIPGPGPWLQMSRVTLAKERPDEIAVVHRRLLPAGDSGLRPVFPGVPWSSSVPQPYVPANAHRRRRASALHPAAQGVGMQFSPPGPCFEP